MKIVNTRQGNYGRKQFLAELLNDVEDKGVPVEDYNWYTIGSQVCELERKDINLVKEIQQLEKEIGMLRERRKSVGDYQAKAEALFDTLNKERVEREAKRNAE